MDRIGLVAHRIDRSLLGDVVFAVAGPIALGAALGMLVASWSTFGAAPTPAHTVPRLAFEPAPQPLCTPASDDDET